MKIFKALLSLSVCLVILLCNIPVASAVYGDADSDGIFTTDDVISTMHFANDTRIPTDEDIDTCDVDRDGYITVNDSLAILKAAALRKKATQHRFTPWEINAEPTCTMNGVAICFCEDCDTTFRKIIPPKGHIYENGVCTGCNKIQGDTFVYYKNKKIIFDDTPEDVKIILGAPQDILTDNSGKYPVQIYVYSSDYKNLGIFTFINNNLTQFYTNSRQAYAQGGDKSFHLNNYSDILLEQGYAYLGDAFVNLYIDHLNNDKPIIYSFCASYGEKYNFNTSSTYTAHEKLNFHLLNGCRALQGKAPLAYCEKVQKVAYAHSLDMANNNYFDHTSPSGKTVANRLNDAGVEWRSCGENIAAGQMTAYQLNAGWYNSEGHRKNMLSDFDKIGIGIAYSKTSNYGYYSTQNLYSDW